MTRTVEHTDVAITVDRAYPDSDELSLLVALYALYLKRERLPGISADELILEDITDAQRTWLGAFIRLWDDAASQAEARHGQSE